MSELMMIFNKNEIAMTRGLSDAFIEILTTKYNYEYSEKFRQKASFFIVDYIWNEKKRIRGAELTEERVDKIANDIFFNLLINPMFLQTFEEFEIPFDLDDLTEEDIKRIVGEENINSRYLSGVKNV